MTAIKNSFNNIVVCTKTRRRKVYKFFVVLLMSIFTGSLITGCGQNQQPKDDKKPVIIKPEVPVTEDTDNEENLETEESSKTVTESAIDKAAALSEAQDSYKAEADLEAPAAPKTKTPQFAEELVVANFDNGEKPNNLGGNFGAWNKDPSDPTQWCKESFDNAVRHGDAGFAMKLDYSVDSPNPAYNGFWMTLSNLDVSKYDAVNLWVKGDSKIGYTTVFKIELKNANKQVGRYYVTNVNDQWQEISIPLSEFKGLIDKASLTEFVIVFEDRMASNKKGVLYIDDIRFVKK